MIVRYIEQPSNSNPSSALYLPTKKLHLVYGLKIDKNSLIIFLHHDQKSTFPLDYDLSYFDIIDSRFSKYWDPRFHNKNLEEIQGLREGTEVSFTEWTEDPNFYYKLVEGEAVPGVFTNQEAKEAIRTFQKYKALMDLEFAMPGIKEKAIDLESDNWLMCPKCDESWQDENAKIHEMVKCPKCATLWLSPVNEKKYIRKSL